MKQVGVCWTSLNFQLLGIQHITNLFIMEFTAIFGGYNSNIFFGVSSTNSNSDLWQKTGDYNRDKAEQERRFTSAGSTAESPMSIGYQNQGDNNFA